MIRNSKSNRRCVEIKIMQNPFDKLNGLEGQVNQAGSSMRNPQGQLQNRAADLQRTINTGTANVVSALCYVTGVVALIPLFKEDWKTNPMIKYHSGHARVIWAAILLFSCTIIGLPVAGLLWHSGFYLASEAVSGRSPHVPFMTQFLYSRGWI